RRRGQAGAQCGHPTSRLQTDSSSPTCHSVGKPYSHAQASAAILTKMDRSDLRPAEAFEGRLVRVEPIAERHREGLRVVAEREPLIHRFRNLCSLGFDRWCDQALAPEGEIPFVICADSRPVGSTRYMNIEPLHRRAEIGWTWLERSRWGTGANIETKYLLLENAFE